MGSYINVPYHCLVFLMCMLYGVVLHLFTPFQDGTPQSLAPRVASPTGCPCRVTLLLHGDELLSFYVLKNLLPLFPNSSFSEYNGLVAIFSF